MALFGTIVMVYLIVGAVFTSIFWSYLRYRIAAGKVSRYDSRLDRLSVAMCLFVLMWPYAAWCVIMSVWDRTVGPKPPNRTV